MHPSVHNLFRKSRPRSESLTTNVLIVDDDPDFLDLLISEIGQIPGVEIHVAHGPAEALKMITLRDYHLIVSDWALDSSTAPEVLSRADHIIGEEPEPVPYCSKIPVMFISGSEKVSQMQVLRTLNHFEPVSFLLKRCGPSLIGVLAEHILARFCPQPELQPC
jgi:CheY-like chemotaxis protein